ncbi:NADP-dependent oxidoreductase [Albibacterium indicum]|uniref:NADP-dependent oxidoreductase n=1 Tax=Albibacterium indicum TaxID=2292082 RepID=UPI000E478584|nr:NADP-dependent oxidoreductase [Pedobacter indicus]
MQAVILTEYGQPGNLELKEIEKPTYNDDQVLIRIKAAGINPVDTKIRAGTSGMCKNISLPVILGFDVSGKVEAVGKNVTKFKVNDDVMGCIGFPGLGKAYAEYTTADPVHLTHKPPNISFGEAAAVPLAGLTAYQTIYDHLQIQAGQRILIQAAAGGVGHLAVQFAKIAGAEVFGTASQKNIPFLKELGVDHPIDYKNSTFEDHVASLDAAMDAMGGEILYRTIKCIKRGGRVVCLPSSTKDDPVAIKLAKEQGVELIWPLMYPDQKQISQIADFMRQGQLKVHVDETFPLNQMAQAHRQVESHHTSGKVVVLI